MQTLYIRHAYEGGLAYLRAGTAGLRTDKGDVKTSLGG